MDFGGDDERQLFTLQFIDDEVDEGDETIQLSLISSSTLEGVGIGVNATTEIIIVENDCKLYPYLCFLPYTDTGFFLPNFHHL